MSQVMQTYHRQASSSQQWLVVTAVEVGRVESVTNRVREYEVGVMPGRRLKTLRYLAHAMSLQSGNGRRGEQNLPPTACGLRLAEGALAVSRHLKRRLYLYYRTAEVDFAPLQPQQFTFSHAGRERQHV